MYASDWRVPREYLATVSDEALDIEVEYDGGMPLGRWAGVMVLWRGSGG